MKILFVNSNQSTLADSESRILSGIKSELLSIPAMEETVYADLADVILIQEKNSFKNFRYIDTILKDPILANYYHKTFTINTDDCATGILRGLYTSLPKSRFNSQHYAIVPFFEYPNELVFLDNHLPVQPYFLASWRGNTKSSKIRIKLLRLLQGLTQYSITTTDSWLNHSIKEKKEYIDLVLNAKFSLCPSGWAAVSFRIYESMALGRCPVIIADAFVPPEGPDWKSFALFLPEKDIKNLPAYLLAYESSYKQRGELAFINWQKYFSQDVIKKYYAQALHRLFCAGTEPSKEVEMRRWTSWHLYWSNEWTIPQRILNKAKAFITHGKPT